MSAPVLISNQVQNPCDPITLTTCLSSIFFTGESVNITIDPQSVTLYGSQKTNNVTVKCAVSTCLPLYNLALSRAVGGNASKTVIDTDVTGSTATEIIPGATYSGSVSERFIAVTLAEASCNDVGQYTCTATFKGLVENASLNLSAHGEFTSSFLVLETGLAEGPHSPSL